MVGTAYGNQTHHCTYQTKPHTCPVYSAFEGEMEVCCFLCIRDSLQSSKSKKKEKKTQKTEIKKVRNGKRGTAHGIYSFTLSYHMKRQKHSTCLKLSAIKRINYLGIATNKVNKHPLQDTCPQTEMAAHKEMRLVLSSDAKPRLKWTSELHQRFVDAVDQLGGSDKATPKSLMRIMGVHGLTLYHLKSHLQKYRMGRSQNSHQNKPQDYDYGEKISRHFTNKTNTCDNDKEQISDLQMTRALQMQMEVQRKLHEQIEVQKHLQLRVEAQGKYLQSVLRKAEHTISEYGSCSIEAENARAQLAELVSMVDSAQKQGSLSINDNNRSKKVFGHHGSLESSLTSSSDQETQHDQQGGGSFISLSLMEMHPPSQKKRALLDTIDLNCNINLDLNSEGDGSF